MRSNQLDIKQVLFGLLVIIPPVILGLLVWRYSVNVPFWDQWETPGRFLIEASQDKLTLSQWMRQHNESRTLVPNFIFLNLAKLTNWNTKYEMLITFLLACLVSVNIYRLSKITFDNTRQHLICFFLANLLIFSPMQHENWLWGFQGIAFSSIAAITTSLVIIFSSIPWAVKLITSAVLSAIATFSFANGVLCWIVIIPALLLKSIEDKVNKNWVIFFWLVASSLTLTIYLYDYHRPSDLPSITQIFTRPGLAISYYSALLGSPIFPQDLLGSQITGAIAFLIFTFLGIYLLFKAKNLRGISKILPWLLIGSYTLFSAGLTTMGRMSLDIENSLSSRYITFATYLIIALIYLFAIVLTQVRKKIWLQVFISLLTVFFLITYKNNFAYGFKLSTASHYQRVYGKTCLITMDIIGDRECISQHIHPEPDKIKIQAKKIDRIGFLQPGLIKNIDWQTYEGKLNKKDLSNYGKLDNFSRSEDGSYIASGWTFALSSKPSFDAVILTYQVANRPKKPFAILEIYPESEDIFKLFINPQNTKLTWNKTFSVREIPPQVTQITAWAFDSNSGKAYQLQGTANLNSSLQSNAVHPDADLF